MTNVAKEGRRGDAEREPARVRRVSVELEIPAEEPRGEASPRDPDALRILILCNYDPFNAATVCDHINAFVRYSRHEVFVLSRVGGLPDDLDLDAFDVVVVHYSLFIALETYVPPRMRRALSLCRALKVLFIQDEYRFVDRTISAIREAGISLVFSCVPEGEIPKVYDPSRLPGVEVRNTLTGYVPYALTQYEARPLAERDIDVGYRGREYPAWHGAAGLEKVEIGRRFLRDAERHELRCDIRWDERSRLYGAQWIAFTQRCRAVLAVESGASVFDFEGRIGPRTEAYATLTKARTGLLGRFLRRHEDEDERVRRYAALRERYFAEDENRIDLSQLSPRVFEAAALRTLLVMYEGRYSGVFEPWRHYVPLRKDHANMDEVVTAIRDDGRVAEIAAEAYAEIAMNPDLSYAAFMRRFDDTVEEVAPSREGDGMAAWQRFDREAFADDHPFYLIDNPHGLTRPKVRRRILRAVRHVPGLSRRRRALRPG